MITLALHLACGKELEMCVFRIIQTHYTNAVSLCYPESAPGEVKYIRHRGDMCSLSCGH